MTVEELIALFNEIRQTKGSNLFVYLQNAESYGEIRKEDISISESGQVVLIDSDKVFSR